MDRRPLTVCPPHGETVESALERIKGAFKPLIQRHQDEAIGLVVGEPIAQLIACHLRRDPRVQLDDHVPTGGFERIVIAPSPAATDMANERQGVNGRRIES